MSVACGPACELQDVYRTADCVARYEYTLLDQDDAALEEARASSDDVERRLGARPAVRLLRDSVRTMLREPRPANRWGTFHCIYSMGLFDYLEDQTARALLAKLYEMLVPGGELVIGNYHTGCPTRTYMEYWMDWVLLYREEQGFLDLASALPGAERSVTRRLAVRCSCE